MRDERQKQLGKMPSMGVAMVLREEDAFGAVKGYGHNSALGKIKICKFKNIWTSRARVSTISSLKKINFWMIF